MMDIQKLTSYVCSIFITVLLGFGSSTLQASQQPIPTGFDDYAVFMATGTIPFTPHPNSQITGCGVSIFCNGGYFHQQIMGRNLAEIAIEKQRAKDYFYSRFGVDTDVLVSEGRVLFSSFFLDPRGEYRAYTVAGRKVHADGWVVRDGGFVLTVIDPAGVEISGEFAGQNLIIPADGLLVFGSYNIQATNKKGKPKDEIVFDYRSEMPMIANAWGELVVNCQISTDHFSGELLGGKAQGMGTVTLSSDFSGLVLNWRNVLSLGGLDLLE